MPTLAACPGHECEWCLQADTYRRMRKLTKQRWEAYCPGTNALWLHYLAEILLTLKACPCKASQTRALRDFRCAWWPPCKQPERALLWRMHGKGHSCVLG